MFAGRNATLISIECRLFFVNVWKIQIRVILWTVGNCSTSEQFSNHPEGMATERASEASAHARWNTSEKAISVKKPSMHVKGVCNLQVLGECIYTVQFAVLGERMPFLPCIYNLQVKFVCNKFQGTVGCSNHQRVIYFLMKHCAQKYIPNSEPANKHVVDS